MIVYILALVLKGYGFYGNKFHRDLIGEKKTTTTTTSTFNNNKHIYII